MGLYFFDDLNSYTLGSPPPSPWLTAPSSGGQVVVEVDPGVGSPQGRVCRIFNDTNQPGDAIRPHGLADQTNITLDLKVYAAATNKKLDVGFQNQFGTGFSAITPLIRFDIDGFVKRFDAVSGGDFSPAVSYVAGTWYAVRMIIDTLTQTNNQLYINSVLRSPAPNWDGVRQVRGIMVRSGTTTSNFYIDDARAAATFVNHTGIVRDSVTGASIVGATVVGINQADRTVVGTALSDAGGLWVMTVKAPDPLSVVFYAYRNQGEGGSARPWVQVF